MGGALANLSRGYLLSIVLAAAMLSGCVANVPYRTTIGLCDAPDCETGSIERHKVGADSPIEYLLGIVEFDDQGAKHLSAQMDVLFAQLRAESAE